MKKEKYTVNTRKENAFMNLVRLQMCMNGRLLKTLNRNMNRKVEKNGN